MIIPIWRWRWNEKENSVARLHLVAWQLNRKNFRAIVFSHFLFVFLWLSFFFFKKQIVEIWIKVTKTPGHFFIICKENFGNCFIVLTLLCQGRRRKRRSGEYIRNKVINYFMLQQLCTWGRIFLSLLHHFEFVVIRCYGVIN